MRNIDYSIIYKYVDKDKYPKAQQMLNDLLSLQYNEIMDKVQPIINKQRFPNTVKKALLQAYMSFYYELQTKNVEQCLEHVFKEKENEFMLWFEIYELV
jgi:hypothetical protein